MATVLPFRALRAAPGFAAQIAAPPYDVLSSGEARDLARDNPLSFLRISKPEIDFPHGAPSEGAAVYARGAENLRRLVSAGHLVRDERPIFHLYRQEARGHSQTGFVVLASCAEVASGVVKRHELTRPDKEDDRARHIKTLGAQTGPAFLLFRSDPELLAILQDGSSGTPDFEFVAVDKVRHAGWAVRDPVAIRTIEAAFRRLPSLYIADGHHRTAAAVRLWKKKPSLASAAGFLAVVFPEEQTRILAYNRFVLDRQGLSPKAFLAKLKELADLSPAASPVPRGKHEVCLLLDGRWLALRWKEGLVSREREPIDQLDVALLQKHVLAPLLGISNPRTSERIRFVGGIRGTAELEKLAAAQAGGVAFSLHPTSVSDLMTIADRGQIMPPKSTWFEPKLRDGLYSHVLDD